MSGSYMGESGSEWLRVAWSGLEWLRVAWSGLEWLRVARSGLEWRPRNGISLFYPAFYRESGSVWSV